MCSRATRLHEIIARRVEQTPGAMVAMSSHGHGRSAAVFGSTCDAVLRELFGPVIVIGPHVDDSAGRLDGAYVVPLDGSKLADGVLPIVAAWTTEFDGMPWVIEVGKDWPTYVGDVVDSSFVSSRALELRRKIDREVQFEVLHDGHAGRSITDFAREMNASLDLHDDARQDRPRPPALRVGRGGGDPPMHIALS